MFPLSQPRCQPMNLVHLKRSTGLWQEVEYMGVIKPPLETFVWTLLLPPRRSPFPFEVWGRGWLQRSQGQKPGLVLIFCPSFARGGERPDWMPCRQSVLFLKKQALCEALNGNNKNHKSREKFKTRDEMNEVSKYVCHLCVQIRMGPRN